MKQANVVSFRAGPFRAALFCAGLCTVLCGCAATPAAVAPSPISDQALAAQYRARNSHGEISGAEAGTIADVYRHNIGKAIVNAPDDKSSSPYPSP
jgi:hypothetical protein